MTKRLIAMFALIAALALGVAPWGDDEESDSGATEQEPVAQIDELTGESTAVTLDAGFVDALEQLKLTPGVVGDAELSNDGVVSFPITGGNVTYYDPAEELRPYVQGIIEHDGSGLSLSAKGTEVELTDFVIDPGTSELTGTVSVNGEVAADSAKLFDLDGSTLNPLEVNEAQGTAVLEGTTVELSDEAATLLNDTFGTDALEGGFVIGVSEITVALPN
jgi:hypothetical protein